MTTNYEFEHADYRSDLTLLKDETLLLPEEWSILYCKVQWNLERECCELFKEMSNQIFKYRNDTYDFLAYDPTNSPKAYKDMPRTVFEHFAYFYPKVQRLVELQEYLKELKQLQLT